MSDWSRVMVCWSSVDRLGLGYGRPHEEQAEAHRARAAEIEDLVREDWHCRLDHVVVEGMACEVVAVYSCNYFNLGHMKLILQALDWDLPENVEVFHKDEEADRYLRWALASEPSP